MKKKSKKPSAKVLERRERDARTKLAQSYGKTQEYRDAQHHPSAQSRKEVKACRFARMYDEDIAASFGISIARLYECYSTELEHGAAEVRRLMAVSAYEAALNGKYQAAKMIETLSDLPLVNGKNPRPKDTGPQAEIFPEKKKHLGKKEAARLAAEEAAKSDRWGSLDDDDVEETDSDGRSLQ